MGLKGNLSVAVVWLAADVTSATSSFRVRHRHRTVFDCDGDVQRPSLNLKRGAMYISQGRQCSTMTIDDHLSMELVLYCPSPCVPRDSVKIQIFNLNVLEEHPRAHWHQNQPLSLILFVSPGNLISQTDPFISSHQGQSHWYYVRVSRSVILGGLV